MLATDTLNRFLPSVCDVVPLQVTTLSECFRTDGTLIWFLSCVCETVVLQVASMIGKVFSDLQLE
jgi:hypothetical protein